MTLKMGKNEQEISVNDLVSKHFLMTDFSLILPHNLYKKRSELLDLKTFFFLILD